MFKTVSDSKKASVALVYPGESFLAKSLCNVLLRYRCQVIAVSQEFAENLLPLFDREGFTFLYLDDFEKKPPQDIDYVFEIGASLPASSQSEFLPAAKKHQAKYAVILEKENEELFKKAKKEKVNFRIAIGHQVFGPGMKFEKNNFISEGLKAGVEGQVLKVPGNGLQRIYPLPVNDFARGIVRAMFVPGTAGQTFGFFGSSITVFSFVHLIKEATKGKSKIQTLVSEKINETKSPDLKALKEIKSKLDWQPQEDLGKAIKKTIWEIREQETTFQEASKSFVGKPKITEEVKDRRPPKVFTPPKAFKEDRVEIEEPVAPLVDLAKKQEKIRLVLKQAQGFPPTSLPSSPSIFSRPHPSPKPPKSPKSSKKSWRFLKIFLFSLLVLILVFVFPFALIGFKAYQGVSQLKKAQETLAIKDLAGFRQQLERAQINFSSAQNLLLKIEPVLTTVNIEGVYLIADFWLSLGKQVTEIGILAAQAADQVSIFTRQLLTSQSVNTDQFVNQENRLATQIIAEISLLQAKLDQEDMLKASLPFFRPQKHLAGVKEYLPAGKELAKVIKDSLPILPSLLAKDSRKTYLVVFQNNMELRPTGGFIGSFGLITFEKERFVDFGVLDVYAADGQLKGHVEPPEKLKEHLGEAGWYLRDSNWDPNFPTSARKAAWFLEKEMGRSVDGVIAINLNFAQKVLAALGEIYLPDYREGINAANLYERAEYHSEIGTFPGSTQKSDFLGSLSNAIFEEIKAGEEKKLIGLTKALYQSLEEQDILVYFDDLEAMEIIQKFGWSGDLKNAKCQMPNTKCYLDYLMLVEANVGVNKANYFINRKIDQKIEIGQEGKAVHSLKITYQNTAQTDSWPAGKYKNYLRVYTPQGSQLLTPNSQLPTPDFEEFLEHGKTVFATLVEVPVNEEKTIEFSYELPERFPQGERVSYTLFFQKQSGMINTSNSLLFSFPVETRPLLISPAGAYSPGTLLFTDSLQKSRLYRIEFAR